MFGALIGDIIGSRFETNNIKSKEFDLFTDECHFTDDDIENEFFGCGGVAEIDDLQRKLIKLGRNGFRHHTVVGTGHMAGILDEAFRYYLGYDIIEL